MADPPIVSQAAFKKTPGTLTIDGSRLAWAPSAAAASGSSSKQQGLFAESLSRILALFASKPETGKHNLKLTFYPSSPLAGDKGVTFNFSHPTTAQEDAARVKGILAGVAAQNRVDKAPPQEVVDVKPVIPPPPPAAGSADASAVKDAPSLSSAPVAGTSTAAASSSSGKQRATTATSKPPPAPTGPPRKNLKQDWELHKRVLVKNPQLANLHYELVQSGSLTDEEFWEGRELLLASESLSSTQRPGRSSQLIDDRWASGSSSKSTATTSGTGQGTTSAGKNKAAAQGTISLTPELIRDLFDEFPDVHHAWKVNVPKNVTEPVFWQRYFNSRLWERHRASARTSGSKGTAAADEMFDKYLGKVDDELEPQHKSTEVVNRFLDLAATEVDHEDSGNAQDITMQAGRQKASLPLMRRFNEHSEKLLKAAEAHSPALAGPSVPHAGVDGQIAKRPRLEPSAEADRDALRFAEIDLPELVIRPTAAPIGLNLASAGRGLFEGSSATGAGAEGAGAGVEGQGGEGAKRKRDDSEVRFILSEVREGFKGWRPVLDKTKLEKKSAEEVMLTLTASVRSRLDAKSDKDAISPATLHALTTLHTSTTEFLRQLYSSVLPPAPSTSATVSAAGATTYHLGAKLTDAQRREKAEKMAALLRLVAGKADELMKGCAEGERQRVRQALGTTLESVEKGLAFYALRRK